MNDQIVAEGVIAVIADSKGIKSESVAPGMTLMELNVDSLDALNIAFALEEKFHIAIPDDQLRGLKTVADAIEGVRKLLAQSTGATKTA